MNTKRLLGLSVLLSGMLALSGLAFAESPVRPDIPQEDIDGGPIMPPEEVVMPEEVVPPDTVNPEPAPMVDTTPSEPASGDDGGGCRVGSTSTHAFPTALLLFAIAYLAWTPRRRRSEAPLE
jgi:hypothetical protein